MKRELTLTFALIIIFIATNIVGQTAATATWQLIADTKATVSGNVSCDDIISIGGLIVRDYTGSSLNGPLGNLQARWFFGTSTNWPVNNTDSQLNTVYLDFVVLPKAGYNFSVDTVRASVGGVGTGNMKANVYYGFTDTSLAAQTKLNATILQLKQASQLTGAGRPADDTLLVYPIKKNVLNGQKFRFRIYPWYKASTGSATRYICTQNIIIKGTTTQATGVEENILPAAYSLEQNYPNPFNPSTKISFSLSLTGFTKLVIADILGREIETLVNKELVAGKYTFDFNAANIPSGVYIYSINSGNFSLSKKMVLIK